MIVVLPFTVDANRMEGKHSKIMRTSNMFSICVLQTIFYDTK